MAMQGNLRDMSVPDLIQNYCQQGKTAEFIIQHNGSEAQIFVQNGEVIHATWENLEGEEAVFQTLAWEEGDFSIEMGVIAPKQSVNRSWSGLLLEGARLFDEGQLGITDDPSLFVQEEKPVAKKRSELLEEALQELLQESSDIAGAAVVGVDGLVYSANVPQKALDENMVGATSAAVLGLSKRSTNQLKRGNFTQTLIQGDDGNIIVASLNDETLFVGLTAQSVNLGMAFAEVRMMSKRLREIL
jgi:predicted regulator of Ras-like GTPase activity (Roadblock/LC7/MglB family)